jgi:hypothetical protein
VDIVSQKFCYTVCLILDSMGVTCLIWIIEIHKKKQEEEEEVICQLRRCGRSVLEQYFFLHSCIQFACRVLHVYRHTAGSTTPLISSSLTTEISRQTSERVACVLIILFRLLFVFNFSTDVEEQVCKWSGGEALC